MNERTKRSFISPLAPKLNVNSYIELFDVAQILLYEWLWKHFIGWNVLNSRIIVSVYPPVGVSTGGCIPRKSMLRMLFQNFISHSLFNHKRSTARCCTIHHRAVYTPMLGHTYILWRRISNSENMKPCKKSIFHWYLSKNCKVFYWILKRFEFPQNTQNFVQVFLNFTCLMEYIYLMLLIVNSSTYWIDFLENMKEIPQFFRSSFFIAVPFANDFD